jgi:hypothetical protein
LLTIINQCVDTITRLAREFELTPAARSRLIAQEDENPVDDLFRLLSTSRPPRSDDLADKVKRTEEAPGERGRSTSERVGG